jgi:prolactin regulatory element-binding protein
MLEGQSKMADPSRPKEAAGGTPIVLCCAHGEAGRLEGLVAVLRDRGNTVELLEGAELEPRVLATVIERYHGGGLYVLCRGGAFDRERIDAVREVLLAHRVPFGRTLTLPALDPAELLERVEQSLRRMVAHAPVQLNQPLPSRGDPPKDTPAQASARQRRPTVMVTPPAERPAVPPPPERPTPPPSPSVAAALDRPAPPRPPPPRPSAPPAAPPRAVRASERATVELPAHDPFRPQASTPTEPAQPIERVDPSAETTADSRPDALMPRLDTAAGAIEIDAEHVEDDPSIRPRPLPPVSFDEDIELDTKVDLTGVLAGIGDSTTVAPAPMPTRGATQVAEAIPFEGYREDDIEIGDVTQVAPAPTAAPPVTTTTVRSPTVQRTIVATAVEPERPSRLRFGVAAVVGSLAIGILAAVIVTAGDDDDEAPKTAQADTTPDTKAVETKSGADAKVEDAKVEDAKVEDTKVEDTKLEDTKVEDTKLEDTKVEDTKIEDNKVEDTKLAVVVPTKPATIEPVAKTPPTLPKPKRQVEVVAPPKTRVQKALRERSIRALDVLLVTRRATAPMGQSAAVAHCEGLDLAGIDEWRLPEIGELASLTDAGILGSGFYWSATAADTFGDSRMAWNGGRRQANWRAKASAVICVRGHGGT